MECGTVVEQVLAPSVRKSNKGCIKIDNPQKKDHADPPPAEAARACSPEVAPS